MVLPALPGLLVAALGLSLPASARAQQEPGAAPRQAPIIDTVVIQRQDVFDSIEAGPWLTRTANKLHVVTNEGVVRNEFLFHAGEPYDSARIAETARNLRSLGIFREVAIDTVRIDSALAVRVITKDAWSTRLNISFRSSGNQAAWALGVNEGNVLGTASQALVQYRQDPDRSSWQLGFARSRLIARTIGLAALYYDISDGRAASLLVAAPFYSQETRWGAGVSGQYFSGRVFRFTNGQSVASDTLERRLGLLRLEGAYAPIAGPEGFLRVGLTGDLKRDDFVPEAFVGPIPSTITGTLGPFLHASRAQFLVTRNFVSFGQEEDVDISSTIRATVYVAPHAFGYAQDGVGPALFASTGFRLPFGFVIASGRGSGLFSSAGLDSGSAVLAGTIALQPGLRHLLLLHGDGGWQKNPTPGQEFDLGLGIGPRAFPAHAFTGDRAFYTTAEYRWTAVSEWLKVMAVGLAGFADYGGAWFHDATRRTGTDFGLGLRLGPSRVAREPPLRLDLAYRLANDVESKGWIFVIQKGFPFQLMRFDSP
jgi:hypothetical protein